MMYRYSILWSNLRSGEFTFSSAYMILKNDTMLNILLSKLRQHGWLQVRFDPDDARKRIYKMMSPEDAVLAMGSEEKTRKYAENKK